VMRRKDLLMTILGVILCLTAIAAGQTRRFPPPDFQSGYEMPTTETPPPDADFYEYIAVAVLAAALGVGTYFIFVKRSRKYAWALMIFSLAFFGFWRMGCVCPIGATQNMAVSMFDPGYAVPITVLIIFLLPLALSLFHGRVFCGTVCPLGAIQDVVLLKPLSVPFWLESSLRLLGYLYLGLALVLAITGAGFIICQYDPFVSFFRLSGNFGVLAIGGAFLIMGVFIGRPYCRFLCPYGILLRQLSRLSKWKVKISPDECVKCRLCEDSCPFGAIRKPTGEASSEELAARKKILAVLILLFPFIVLAGGFGGSQISGLLSRSHHDVRLADRIYLEESGQVEGTTDESEAFRGTGESIESLYELSAEIQAEFSRGSWILGGFIGLVIGGTLIKHTIRRNSDEYLADAGDCLACGRCFEYCPRERLRLSKLQEDKQVLYG